MKLKGTIWAIAAVTAGNAMAADRTVPAADLGNLAVTYADSGTTGTPTSQSVAVTYAQGGPVGSAVNFIRPKVGIRVGGGEASSFMLNGGVDVTFNVPLLPLPGIRLDGEVWGTTSDFGSGNRGDALSLLGVETFLLGYAGIGPTYYFSDNNGDHHSGFGAKLLAGMSVPGGFFVEAGLLVGPSPLPVFITVGERF